MRSLNEIRDVLHVSEFGIVAGRGGLFGLVDIPGEIGFDAVKAGVFEFLQAILPEFLRAAEVVHRAGVDEDWFVVDQKRVAVVANAIGVWEVDAGGWISSGTRQAARNVAKMTVVVVARLNIFIPIASD